MRFHSLRNLPAVVAIAIAAGLIHAATPAGAAEPVARYDAIALNPNTTGSRRGPIRVQISIERWSADAERAALKDALVEKGEDALLNALRKVKPRVGSISTPGQLGWDIRFAERIDLPGGGHRVVFATDRPMTFREEWNRDRSTDYQFMLCELRVGPDGKGEGKLAPRARISWDPDARTMEIENYDNEPVRLTGVTETKPRR